ncbi:MAG: hypothetical protein R6X23_09445 [Acidimicrobiia bacterium]
MDVQAATRATLQAAIDDFLEDQEYKGNSPATLRFYRTTLGRFRRATTLNYVDELDVSHIRSWLVSHQNVSRATLVTEEIARLRPCYSNFMQRLRVSRGVEPRLVWYWLNSAAGRQQLAQLSNTTTGLANLNGEILGRVAVPVVPKEEQRRIVAFLDYETGRIDELVRQQEDLRRLLAERRTAVVASAVLDAPDGQASGRLSDGWTRAKLGYRYAVELGKMLDAKQNIGGNQYPYLRNQDVQWGRINCTDLPSIKLEADEVARYTVSDGDVPVCEGGDVGRAAIWRGASGEVAYQKALHRLRPLNPKQDVPEYLVYQLVSS